MLATRFLWSKNLICTLCIFFFCPWLHKMSYIFLWYIDEINQYGDLLTYIDYGFICIQLYFSWLLCKKRKIVTELLFCTKYKQRIYRVSFMDPKTCYSLINFNSTTIINSDSIDLQFDIQNTQKVKSSSFFKQKAIWLDTLEVCFVIEWALPFRIES